MNISDKTKIVFVSEPGVMQEAILHILSQREADVVIIDANIPLEEMLALVRSITVMLPPVACIALTSTRSQMRLAMAEGANAALPRSSPSHQISEAIQTTVRRANQP